MTRLIDAELLTTKISFASFPHTDRNGRMDKSWVYELINSCPTVAPKKGKWLPYKWDCAKKQAILLPEGSVTEYVRNQWESKVFICNVCGKGANEANFCPNCGAEMEANNE